MAFFEWSAKLIDGTTIKEFDKKGKEHLFKEVIDVLNNVEVLTLSWDEKYASVNFKNGHFNINGENISFKDLSDRKEKYRPIYFKRVRQAISTGISNPNENIKYHIGYQITINSKNYQRILKVDNITKQMEFVEKNIMELPLWINFEVKYNE